MQSRSPQNCLLLLLTLAVTLSPAGAKPRIPQRPEPPERPAASGVYIDEAGGRHEWQVTRGHALLWGEQPYLPAGVVFRPLSLYDSGPDAWARDRQELEALHAAGARDLLVEALKGLSHAPEGALTRLVEALNEHDFRYGLLINDRPTRPIRGYWLQPHVVPVSASEVAPGANSRWTVPVPTPGAESVLFALVDTANGAPLHAGRAPVVEGRAGIAASFRPARRLFPPGSSQLLVLPERTFDTDGETPPPTDLWGAGPGYLEGLLRALRGPRWGPGLRFILDPIQVDTALRGDIEDLLPSSSAFRVEFEAWLQQRGSAADLSIAWALTDRNMESLQVAARLVPFWHRDETGPEPGWFVDPETLALYRVDRRRSRFWRDLEGFRVASARRAMNTAADLLKERALGVPILYRWTQLHPIFTNSETSGGWDGLVAPAAQPTPLAYAQCEASARTLWCWAMEDRAGADRSAPGPDASDGESAERRSDPGNSRVGALATMGMRGLFSQDHRFAAAPTPRVLNSSSPWGDEKTLAGSKPPVLFYPVHRMPGFGATRLSNGVWWLPAFTSGRMLILGDGLEGYQIDLPFGNDPAPTAVVWSTAGEQKATFVVPREREVRVYDAQGAALKVKPSKGRLRLEMSALPYVLGGLEGETLFPVEAAAHALAELEALLQMAEARKLNPNVLTALKAAIADARAVFTERTAATAYDLVRGPLELLRELLSPYIWLEGERPRESHFSGVAPDSSASEGALLLLSSTRDPAGGSYVARYTVNVTTSGLYELWLAGSPPGQEGASPMQWRLEREGTTASEADGPLPSGKAGGSLSSAAQSLSVSPVAPPPSRVAVESVRYGSGLAWTRLGSVRLEPGRYRLSLAVSERNGDRYLFRVDALLFAREPFRPDGVRKPVWRVSSTKGASGGERR
jgi:hypothetical protein